MSTEKVDGSTRAIRLTMGSLYFSTDEFHKANKKWEAAEEVAREFEERYRQYPDMPAAVVAFRRELGRLRVGGHDYHIETRGTRHCIIP